MLTLGAGRTQHVRPRRHSQSHSQSPNLRSSFSCKQSAMYTFSMVTPPEQVSTASDQISTIDACGRRSRTE